MNVNHVDIFMIRQYSDAGIEPETAFEDIPDDWTCPICGLGKDVFVPVED